ncbi:MAG: hypothetical protein HYX35_05960 [Proteobacteria bacterium]|nr:hypothetical protein [Pseudomonadota bacterium]
MNKILLTRIVLVIAMTFVSMQSASAMVVPQTTTVDQQSQVTKTWWRGRFGYVHPGPGPIFMENHPGWDLNHPFYSTNPQHWVH